MKPLLETARVFFALQEWLTGTTCATGRVLNEVHKLRGRNADALNAAHDARNRGRDEQRHTNRQHGHANNSASSAGNGVGAADLFTDAWRVGFRLADVATAPQSNRWMRGRAQEGCLTPVDATDIVLLLVPDAGGHFVAGIAEGFFA
jgi:hypothetical protein